MTNVSTDSSRTGALRLLGEILAAYGSLDTFFAQVRREFEYPTEELPRATEQTAPIAPIPDSWISIPPTTGRHARIGE